LGGRLYLRQYRPSDLPSRELRTLQSVAGVDVFPALPDAVKKAKPAALPPV
jgi:hypothetical protein